MLIQLLVIIALFRVMQNTTKYVFPEGVTHLKTNFFWIENLLNPDPLWYGLPLLTSLSQFGVTLFSMKTNPQMQQQGGAMGSMNTMMLVMPLAYYFFFVEFLHLFLQNLLVIAVFFLDFVHFWLESSCFFCLFLA